MRATGLRAIGVTWVLTGGLLFAPSARAAEGGAPAETLKKLEGEYLAGLFRAKPHLATFMGEHGFDDRLPDWSDKAVAEREKEQER